MSESTTTVDLGPAAGRLVALLDGITDDQLDGPTPCEGTSVAGLLDHVMGLALAFTGAANKSGGDDGPGASAEALDPEWRRVLPERLTGLVDAWRDPAAWEGDTKAGGVTMPAAIMGCVALNELAIHGWDLARSTGQAYECDAGTAEACMSVVADLAGTGDGVEGLFGPAVAVPADAPLFDRVLGLTGRDPSWTAA